MDPLQPFGGLSSLRNIICLAAAFTLTTSVFSRLGSSSCQSCFSWTNYSAHSGLFHRNQRWARKFISCMQLEVTPFDRSMERRLNAHGSSLTWILRMSHGLVFKICWIGHLFFVFPVKWLQFNQIIKSSTIITVMKKKILQINFWVRKSAKDFCFFFWMSFRFYSDMSQRLFFNVKRTFVVWLKFLIGFK